MIAMDDTRMEQIETRMDRLEARVERFEARVDARFLSCQRRRTSPARYQTLLTLPAPLAFLAPLALFALRVPLAPLAFLALLALLALSLQFTWLNSDAVSTVYLR